MQTFSLAILFQDLISQDYLDVGLLDPRHTLCMIQSIHPPLRNHNISLQQICITSILSHLYPQGYSILIRGFTLPCRLVVLIRSYNSHYPYSRTSALTPSLSSSRRQVKSSSALFIMSSSNIERRDQDYAPIPFVRPNKVDESKRTYYTIKVNQGGQQVHYQATRFGLFPFTDNEALMTTVVEFDLMADTLNWDDQTSIQQFINCLQDSAIPTWQSVSTGVATFGDAIEAFIEDYITEPSAGEDQREHLRRIRKPGSISVKDYFRRFAHIIMLSDRLPQLQGQPIFTDDEKTRILYNGLPRQYKDKFEEHGRSIINETLGTIKAFAIRMEKLFPPPKPKETTNSFGSSNNNQPRNSSSNIRRGGSNTSSQNRGNNNANRNRGGSNRGNNQQPQQHRDNPDDLPCPFAGHQNHLWKDCRKYNPKNQGQIRSTSDNRSAQGNRQGQSHYNNRSASNPSIAENNTNGNQGDNHFFDLPEYDPTGSSYHFDFAFQEAQGYDTEEDSMATEDMPSLLPRQDDDSSIDSDDLQILTETHRFQPTPAPKIPSTLVSALHIGQAKQRRALIALLDSGGSHCMINRRVVPKGAIETIENSSSFATTAGNLKTQSSVVIDKLALPEFSRHLHLKNRKCFIFDAPIEYDIILGRDFLKDAGINLHFADESMEWMDHQVSMKPLRYWNEATIQASLAIEPASVHALSHDSHAVRAIADSSYEKADLMALVQDQTHLTMEQRNDLHRALAQFEQLFSGRLGQYPHKKFHLELKPNAVPFHSKPYQVPRLHLPTFKKELDRLVEIKVLRKAGATKWAAGTFIIPKKDGKVRWVSDFRKLNEWIVRKQYPLPKVQEVVQKQEEYEFITKLDVSMQYYTFQLDEESQELCTIVTPFGKYHYNVLPMGVCQSPDYAQATMEECLHDLIHKHGVVVYIDDIKITSKSWNEHIKVVSEVLHRLQENGFTVNPLKCEWAVKETDFLGFWFTPTGVQPWAKKTKAILQLAPPTNRTQVRAFCGAVTFYRDMFPRRAHILAPITRLQSKDVPFQWTTECQQAFDTMKGLIAQETLLAYPDPNQPFDVYTDASDVQLGAVIKQHGRPVAFYSRKLSAAQQNYTTIEKELLSVVETLREFKSFLFGAQLTVHTDHINLTTAVEHTNARVLRWRMFLEDFHPRFVHISGVNNVIADGLSRTPLEGQKASVSNNTALESLIFLPAFDINNPQYPLDFELIAEQQPQDHRLTVLQQQNPQQFTTLEYPTANGSQELVCFRSTPNADWRVYLPNSLVPSVTEWYHHMLGHAGADRLARAVLTHFYCPRYKEYASHFVSRCLVCQTAKLPGPGISELPPKNITNNPWDEVAVDLVGPWTFKVNGQTFTFFALTCVDTLTAFSDIIRINNKESVNIAAQFEMEWLSRYPRPLRCIHDQGTEFTGAPFQLLLQAHGIKDVPITVKNPQANAIVERLHQTMGNILRTFLNSPLVHQVHPVRLIDHCFASTRFALRASFHRTLEMAPGAAVFQRDMILPIPLIANVQALQQRRQLKVDANLLAANRRRRFHDYSVGDRVLVVSRDIKGKLQPPSTGPFTITAIHTNGTVVIRRRPQVYERINIRRIKPYHG
eukprot:scaffold9447_cov94-Amphora_coffeaeformis.AAC.1